MTSLYIDRKGISLHVQKDALILQENQERRATIPLRLLERVILISQVQLSAQVLSKLGELGIGVMVLGGLQRNVHLLMPAKNDVNKRRWQYQYCDQNAVALSKALLQAKITAQASHLQQQGLVLNESWSHVLEQVDQAENLTRLLGIEGNAAKNYWQALAVLLNPEWQFTGRRKNPSLDPINALLSLSYTLIYGESVRLITAAGFDAYHGFYHQPNAQRAALACDVMEPVRALIDQWIWQQITNRTWQPQDFIYQQSACLLAKSPRQLYYQLFESQAEDWKQALKQSIQNHLSNLYRQETEHLPTQWLDWEDVCNNTRDD